jgi:hypothetical protein
MSTTAVFAEILIVGLQATVWVALLAVTIIGPQQKALDKLKDWSALITVFALAVAYTLGIIVDRVADSVADSVFEQWDEELRKELREKLRKELRKDNLSDSLPLIPQIRLCIMSESAGMTTFLDYIRSRMRIARSTAINVALIIAAAILLGVKRPEVIAGLGRDSRYALAAVGIVVFVFAVFTWKRITKAYYWRAGEAYIIVCKKKEHGKDTAPLMGE